MGVAEAEQGASDWEAAGGAGGPLGGHWASHWEATGRPLGQPHQEGAPGVQGQVMGARSRALPPGSVAEASPLPSSPAGSPRMEEWVLAGCCLFLAGSRGQLWCLPRTHQGTTHPD